MSNTEFNNINVPDNIDIFIENGVKQALDEKKIKKNGVFKKVSMAIVASLIALVILNITNPALASRLPIVGSVFNSIEKNIYYPGNYSGYATKVNESVHSNDATVTLSEILCDGRTLYVTYIIEKDTPFRITSHDPKNDGKEFNENQMLIDYAYGKANFSNDELCDTGFAGLEGKFVNDKTFVGMEEYHLDALKMKIPDEFNFKVKINSFYTQHRYKDYEDKDITKGTWAFSVPVKVDKSIRKEISVEDCVNNDVKIESLSISKFDTILNYKSLGIDIKRTNVSIYYEDGEELSPDGGSVDKGNNTEWMRFTTLREGTKKLRIVVNMFDEEQKIIFDKVVNIE